MTAINKNDSDRNPGRKAYYQRIKERLVKHEQELNSQGFQLIYSQLAENIYNRYNIETSDQKIRAIFSTGNDREIPLAEMVALCHMLHIPIYDLVDFPDAQSVEINPPWIKTSNNASSITHLDNPYYYGTYYCYYFSRRYLDNTVLADKTQSEAARIRSAKLSINEENGMIIARFKETFIDNDFYNSKPLEQNELSGRVNLVGNSSHFYTMLTDSYGKYIISLLFNYYKYNKDIMYYRTAAMTSVSNYPLPRKPVFQKMLLFRVKQNLNDPETENILRGILTLNSNNIIIEKEKFNQLLNDDNDLSLLSSTSEDYYIFNEDQILNQRLPWSYEDKINKILKLRQHSISPSQEIIQDDKNFSSYIKSMQSKLL